MKAKNMAARTLMAAVCVVSTGWAAPLNTGGNLGVARALSARPLRSVKLNLLFGVNYGQESDLVLGPVNYQTKVTGDRPLENGSPTTGVVDAARMLSGNLAIGLGIVKLWDVAVNVPLYYDWLGFGDLTGGGVGDPEISTKICIPPAGKVWFNALHLGGTIPVGTDGGLIPRHPSYEAVDDTAKSSESNSYGFGAITLTPMWLTTLDFKDGQYHVPFAIHLNLGARLALDGSGRHIGIGALALEYTPADFISLFVDYWMEHRLDNFSEGAIFRDPAYVTPGVRITTPTGLSLVLAADICVSLKEDEARETWTKGDYTYSTAAGPTIGIHFSFGWSGFLNAQDADRDGVKDNDDRCPKDAEDEDGFEDSDGCPDEDNDADGKKDVDDKCPNKPEDDDGFEDDDGCPDPDNDKDGIPDEKDRCPNDPEDFDGFEDSDGCPDPDNDNDGIADSLDRCPNDPEDFDQFEDDDGCADIDNDKDGIPDLKDKCPNQPETFNGIDDADGCPDVKEKKQSRMPKHQIMHGIKFRSGSAVMTIESYRFLEPIINEMKEYPDVEIEIRGHTDSVGKYETNMKLSQQRAESVLQYMASKGVDPSRMRAVGYGPSSPIADNRTASGRSANRRIEIVRTK